MSEASHRSCERGLLHGLASPRPRTNLAGEPHCLTAALS